MGAYSTYEDSMFAGVNSVFIYNCTPNSVAGPTDAVRAITVSPRHCRYLPSVTHFYVIHRNSSRVHTLGRPFI